MGSTSPIKSATETSGVASFSVYLSSLPIQIIGVSSPNSATLSFPKRERGFNGSSLSSDPSITGMNSSNKWIICRAILVFACPLSPNRFILCIDNIALSISGITVSSYPQMPSKTFSLFLSFRIKLSLNSCFIGFGS